MREREEAEEGRAGISLQAEQLITLATPCTFRPTPIFERSVSLLPQFNYILQLSNQSGCFLLLHLLKGSLSDMWASFAELIGPGGRGEVSAKAHRTKGYELGYTS